MNPIVIEGTTCVEIFKHQAAGGSGSQRGMERATDGYMQKIDGAVDWTIARAIRDATQTTDPALQQEAAAWLWICCPDVAEQVELPELHVEHMANLAAGYVMDGA